MPNKRRIHRRQSNKIEELLSNRNFKIIVMILLLIIIVFSIIVYKMRMDSKNEIAKQKELVASQTEELYSKLSEQVEGLTNYKSNKIIRVSAVGDILCGSNLQKFGSDYNNIFTDIKQYLANSDINIGTFEFNVNEDNQDFANAVKSSGVNLVSIAHNHALDSGEDALENTKSYIENLGMEDVGKSYDSAENRVKIKEIKGVKIAFLAYTYDNKKSGVNIYSETLASQDLNYAKQNASFIIVMMHWGNANTNVISEEQKNQAQFLINNGANVIVGAHPSTVQKMEIIKNTNGEDCFVAYSLGDYTSDFAIENANLELILNLQIFVDTDGKASLYKVDYTPVYMNDFGIKYKENRYKILDMKNEIANFDTDKSTIDKSTYQKLLRVLEKLKEVLEIE